MSWLGLEGKVGIVTGGALGVGRAVCEAFASVGMKIAIADIQEKAGSELLEKLRKEHGADCTFVKTDVTSKADVERLVSETVSKFGRLDVLVNNAGINIPRLLVDPAGKEEVTEDSIMKTLRINHLGYFLCAQAAARAMLKNKKGVIINLASESGMEGSEGQSVYASTKASAYNMTRSWAKELGRHGIRIVGVAPGILEATALRSPEYERALAYTRGITVDELRSKYEKQSIPIGRVGKLSEVADVVCFLASDRASYIHGTTVNVSGGKTRT